MARVNVWAPLPFTTTDDCSVVSLAVVWSTFELEELVGWVAMVEVVGAGVVVVVVVASRLTTTESTKTAVGDSL